MKNTFRNEVVARAANVLKEWQKMSDNSFPSPKNQAFSDLGKVRISNYNNNIEQLIQSVGIVHFNWLLESHIHSFEMWLAYIRPQKSVQVHPSEIALKFCEN